MRDQECRFMHKFTLKAHCESVMTFLKMWIPRKKFVQTLRSIFRAEMLCEYLFLHKALVFKI